MDNPMVEHLDEEIHAFFGEQQPWATWPTTELCDVLLRMFPSNAIAAEQTLLQRFQEFTFDVDLNNPAVLNTTLKLMLEIQQSFTEDDLARDEAAVVAYLIKQRLKGHRNGILADFALTYGATDAALPQTLREFRIALIKHVREARAIVSQAQRFGTVTLRGDQSGRQPTLPKKPNNTAGQQSAGTTGNGGNNPPQSSGRCDRCGRGGHNEEGCLFRKTDGSSWHPNANLSGTPWAESAMGKAWKEQNEAVLPFTKDLKGKPVKVPDWVTAKQNKSGHKSKSIVTSLNPNLLLINDNDLIKCRLTLPTLPGLRNVPSQTSAPVLDANCLLDNGALGKANFVSIPMAAKLIQAGPLIIFSI